MGTPAPRAGAIPAASYDDTGLWGVRALMIVIDTLGGAATLRERWGSWSREPFTADSRSHVSVWVKTS